MVNWTFPKHLKTFQVSEPYYIIQLWVSQIQVYIFTVLIKANQCFYKWPNSVPFYSWVIFHCIYVPHLLYPFLCWWTFKLLPCPGYCKQCCNEQWGACVFLNSMEYYSAIKRNEIGSFVETWMDLETVIQSEVSQKEKNKYRILMHICGIRKNWYRWSTYKAEIENKYMDTKGERGGVGWIGRLGLTYIHHWYYV